jgi:hypothetical protein
LSQPEKRLSARREIVFLREPILLRIALYGMTAHVPGEVKFEKLKENHNETQSYDTNLGLCLAVLAVAVVPAYARSTTGFASFHVPGGPYPSDPYLWPSENNGAVVNNCSFSVNLVFDLPVDNTGTHYITLQTYWGSFGATTPHS